MGLILSASSAEFVTTTSTKTLIRILSSSTVRCRLLQWSLFFDGVSNTDEPYDIQLLIQTTAGTNTAITSVPLDTTDTRTPTSAAAANFTSTEPTSGNVLYRCKVHPQVGMVWEPPVDGPVIIGVSVYLALKVLTPLQSLNCVPTMIFEEI